MTVLWFDCETFSECDLKKHGTPRYAEHPSTEITVAQWAFSDGEPFVFDCTDEWADTDLLDQLKRVLRYPDTVVVAHNSMFDRTLLRHCWGIDVPRERWRDTMVQALAHGLPGSLDKIGTIVGLPADQAKDKRGRELIQLFCKPRPKGHSLRRATRETHPQEWQEFLEYSRQDIVAMRAIHQRLPVWNLREGGAELALWHLDQKINDRGFAVDLDLAGAAIKAVADEQARLKAEMVELTDGAVSSPSKRDELLLHILMDHGVSLPDMKADTLRRRLEDPELPDPVKLLLAIRLEATKASTAKYKALVAGTSADGRLRNTTQFCGASRTGRDAHRLFQPGNMPRGDMPKEDVDLGIEALKSGAASLIFPDVMRLAANTIRGCIVATPGKRLKVADLSNIEGRGLAGLAGEQWKLDAFAEYDVQMLEDGNWITGPEWRRRTLAGEIVPLALDAKGETIHRGHDLYKLSYARAFNVDPALVTKVMRQIGKVMELGLGYQGGVGAFITFAAVYGMDLDELANQVWASAPADWLRKAGEMLAWTKKGRRSTFGLSDRTWIACETLVLMWRDSHPATVALWKDLEESLRCAIQQPGTTHTVRQLKIRRDGAWLRIRLPSGRYLCYVNPKVEDDGKISYMGVNQYTRQWCRIHTYGGKTAEQCTQAWARDVLFYRTPDIEAAGYEILVKIHDELLTQAGPHLSHQRLAAMMATPHEWAAHVPLAAAGFETDRYEKG